MTAVHTPPTPEPAAARKARPAPAHPPLLDQLAQWYPRLFGAHLLPLKRGIFEDLMAAHALDQAELKQALAWHARSTRYLAAVASGQPRHDLQGKAVEPVAPEHVHHALLQVFRRRQQRTQEDLSAQLRQRIVRAWQASGLGRQAYAERVRGRDEAANAQLDAALADAAAQDARAEALLRAFEAGTADLSTFAAMYGLAVSEVQRALARARQLQAGAAQAAA